MADKLPLHAYAPDKPCGCVKADVKAAITEIRTKVTDALGAQPPHTIEDWRDVALDIFNRLKGL